MRTYHVVFNINRTLDLPYLAVAVRSLVRHFAEPSALVVHILWSQLSLEEWSRLEQSWLDLDCQFQHHNMDDVFAERSELPGFGYWNWLWHSEVLATDISSVLCLDCDIVVYDDISPLWNLDLCGKIAAAVYDPGTRVHNCVQSLSSEATSLGLQYDASGPYFNGGVYFVNLIQWRRQKVLKRLQGLFDGRYDRLRFHDQDGLNLLFADKILALSPQWNLLESLKLYEEWDFGLYSEFGDPREYFQAKIRHFSGQSKPDSIWVGWVHQQTYYHYLDQTAWRGHRSDRRRTWWSSPLAHLIDFHYLLVRGLRQRALPDLSKRLRDILKRAPYLPLIYPVIPIYRAWLKLKNFYLE